MNRSIRKVLRDFLNDSTPEQLRAELNRRCLQKGQYRRSGRIEKMGDLLWALDNSDGVFRGKRFMHMSAVWKRTLWQNQLDLSLGKLFYAVYEQQQPNRKNNEQRTTKSK